MRYILLIFSFFILFQCFAQDTIYISKTGIKVKDRGQMDTYEIIKIDSSNTKRATISHYFKSGQLKSTVEAVNERSLKSGEYKTGVQALEMYNDIRWLFDEEYKEWYRSGNIRKEIGFRRGGNCDLMLIYWDNGKLKRKEVYDKNWNMISGECFDSNGNKINFSPYYTDAVYNVGNYKSPTQFYYSKISYPIGALKRNASANIAVFTQFDNKGKVIDAFVRHPGDRDLDSAALSLAKSIGSLTKPSYVDDEPVAQQIMFTFRYTLPKFTIDLIEKANGLDSVYIDKNGFIKSQRKGCTSILLFKPVPSTKDDLFFSVFDKNGKLISMVKISKSKTIENIRKRFKPLTNSLFSTMQLLEICKVISGEEQSEYIQRLTNNESN